jgi:hypothetical protein
MRDSALKLPSNASFHIIFNWSFINILTIRRYMVWRTDSVIKQIRNKHRV